MYGAKGIKEHECKVVQARLALIKAKKDADLNAILVIAVFAALVYAFIFNC